MDLLLEIIFFHLLQDLFWWGSLPSCAFLSLEFVGSSAHNYTTFSDYGLDVQGVKKVPDPKQNYIGLMTEG